MLHGVLCRSWCDSDNLWDEQPDMRKIWNPTRKLEFRLGAKVNWEHLLGDFWEKTNTTIQATMLMHCASTKPIYKLHSKYQAFLTGNSGYIYYYYFWVSRSRVWLCNYVLSACSGANHCGVQQRNHSSRLKIAFSLVQPWSVLPLLL